MHSEGVWKSMLSSHNPIITNYVLVLNLCCFQCLFNYLEIFVTPDICFVKLLLMFLVSTEYFLRIKNSINFVLSLIIFMFVLDMTMLVIYLSEINNIYSFHT
jgi:hypothetical protein